MNPEKREARRVVNFWKKIRIRGKDECWPWTGALDQWNYGMFYIGQASTIHASRFALKLKLGRDILAEEKALHTCDNPRCMNPKHLICGTTLENVKDRQRKGRSSRGFGHAIRVAQGIMRAKRQ